MVCLLKGGLVDSRATADTTASRAKVIGVITVMAMSSVKPHALYGSAAIQIGICQLDLASRMRRHFVKGLPIFWVFPRADDIHVRHVLSPSMYEKIGSDVRASREPGAEPQGGICGTRRGARTVSANSTKVKSLRFSPVDVVQW
jgi:hypothetical protein